MQSLALISPPWPLFNRPSIQLGTLKAYLADRFPDLTVSDHHVYLEVAAAVGYNRYRALSGRAWLAETVYGALLNPDRIDAVGRLFRAEAKGETALAETDFGELTAAVKGATDRFIDRTDWGGFGLVGASASLCQLTATLYVLREIKRRVPGAVTVVGGSTLAGSGSMGLFEAFPEIDVLVKGEGELPLARLVGHFRDGGGIESLGPAPGIATRTHPDEDSDAPFCQMTDLADLPTPDYSAYFRSLQELPPARRFFPTLPVEISRGCWWRRPREDGDESGCAFCNLNLQWSGYRMKTEKQAAADVARLTKRHQLLSVSFMDNALPADRSEAIFAHLAALGMDLDLFGEIRAGASRDTLRNLAAAGLREVQIGIEALSTNLLKKLNKGTTAIQNLEIMKWCEELGIKSNSNLISQFPGSSDEDVAETLRAIAAARNFRPLRYVRFWLGTGSPVWQDPRRYGIRAVFNHPNYRVLLGDRAARQVRLMIQSYRGDRGVQRKRWRPVKKAAADWKSRYDALHRAPSAGPILSYRDGGDFMIIRQRRRQGEPVTHRLVGPSRQIYLFCRTRRHLRRIAERFSHIPVDRIQSFLKMMADKGLMFREGDRVLSLAVRLAADGRSRSEGPSE